MSWMGMSQFYAGVYEVVDDPSLDSIISWSKSNKSFVIWDSKELVFRDASATSCHSLSAIFVESEFESSRPSVVAEQGWGDVFQTCSTVKSVPSLLRGCEADCATFIIPRADQRPWSARIGFYCVYESLFEKDSKLWFPIPRLITSYCSRRDIALTKLMIGTARIAVALMVMAAEADVSMSVRFFEELTQTQPKLNGIYAVQMRSGLHILSGHPSRTKYWQRSYFYVRADKIAFEEPPGDNSQFLWSHLDRPNTVVYPEDFWYEVHKIMALSEQQWKSFDRIRIPNQQRRIAKVDWASNIPCEETKGKRMPLPLMGKITRAYPSYSDIGCREFQFHDRRKIRSTTPLRNKPPNKAKVRSEEEEPGPGMSCKEVDHSIDKIGGEGEDVRVENPKGLTGKKRKRRPKDIVSRSADDSEELVVSLPAGRHDGPLVNDQATCSNLMRQIRGGTRRMPEVTELAFLDNFSESARADSTAVA
ncbi:PREDICTED: uncharacterized protein LOC106335701 [Brassica oleracea var. oleracea]|uniref:uncharacterized protein LOC106335701 n=1 Tax=Brassica oleracea var. oleracea TaxID=109376 RepID=UPI0006A6B5B4|nr:PREDICTED: uncharacterized protein LOC106335701 [Brassica oleracea var. oleracea]